MKSGWKTEPLGDLCEIFADGDWVESKDQSSDGVRLIQTGNVGEGFFKDRAEKARYISEATFKRLRCTEIFEGDCLISRLPDPVGRNCILPETGERMITAVDCTIVRFNPQQLLPAFFNHYSQSDDYLTTVAKECTGTTRNRISRSNLALTPIPVPPLPEQKRIVGILDEAFEGIATAKANAEKNLQNARTLFDSHLSTAQKITPEGAKQSRFVKEGDFILTNSMSFGRPYIMKTSGCIHDGWFVLRLNISIDADYFYYLLSSRFVQSQFAQLASGAVVKNISGDLVKKAVLPIPPLAHQQVIVEKLLEISAETQRLESIYRQKLAALEALKKSFLHQAFSGEL